MAKLLGALVFVLAVNLLLWLGQVAILDLNPNAEHFLSSDSPLYAYIENDTFKQDVYTNLLPESEGTVTEGTTTLWTDPFNTIKNWFLDTTGLKYLTAIFSAPYSFMRSIGLPETFASMVSALWYALTIFLVLNFIKGGGGD